MDIFEKLKQELKKEEKTIDIVRKSIEEVYAEKKKDFKYMKENEGRLGPKTCFPEIDKLTKGFRRGSMVGIGAYSNTGKSQISYYYAQNFLKQGLKVTYFSLEMKNSIVLTMIEQYYNKISFIEAIRKENEGLFDKFEMYDSNDYYTIEQIEAYCRLVRPDIIFIDYIQLLAVEGDNNEYSRLNTIARRFGALGNETGTIIIYLSQISNEDNKTGGVLEVGLKGSGELVAKSDYVFIMKKGNLHGEIIYGLKKNKYGPAYKTYSLLFDFEKGICIFDGESEIEIKENKKFNNLK